MTYLIPAVYENGVLKTSTPLNFPDRQKVLIAVTADNDDAPSLYIDKIAEESPGYAFLNSPQEDLYTRDDGEEI